MNSNINCMIEEEILSLIDQNFQQKELKTTAKKYLRYYKEGGFPLGNLTILAYTLHKEVSSEIYKVASITELIMFAFDILDDLEDDDNPDTPWFSEKEYALNVITGILFIIIQRITTLNIDYKIEKKLQHILTQYAFKAIEGQHIDLLNNINSEREYIELVSKKSASLFILAYQLGTITAKQEYSEEGNNFIRYIGIAEQINNDINDILKLSLKNDLIRKKKTLPVIYLLNHESEKYSIFREYYRNNIDKQLLMKDKENLKGLIIESGALKYCEVMRRIFLRKAIVEGEKTDLSKALLKQLNSYIR
ncbi:polyprenyl synthetase family protein [Bacillus pacificus]|uniref:polyprenyl synthetase family protein n=1 Tax=Bacillus TaxID=1386 RepID=UPI001FB29212|nr:polyprenyl synthetase family protein [Bacillus sp. ZJS3]UOB79045.1 class 1 isoprenoid biosynthesis enzyme [Bacillus sp. ZJS3]